MGRLWFDRLKTGLTVVLAAWGAVSGFYFYDLEVEKVLPTFVVDPTPTILVEPSKLNNAPLKVVRADGGAIDVDVSAVRVYFWNAGKKPIFAADVRTAIRITSADAEILDFKVVRAGRVRVTRASVERAPDSRKNALQLSFDVLEENDGIGMQLLLAGNPASRITISGDILGARTIADNAAVIERRYVRSYLESAWDLALMVLKVVALLLFVVLVFSGVVKAWKQFRPRGSENARTAGLPEDAASTGDAAGPAPSPAPAPAPAPAADAIAVSEELWWRVYISPQTVMLIISILIVYYSVASKRAESVLNSVPLDLLLQ